MFIAVIAKGHDLAAALDLRHEGGSLQRTVQQGIRLANLQTRLPDIVAVVVLNGHQLQHQGFVAEELCLLAVRGLQCIVELENLIEGNGILLGNGHADLGTASLSQQTQRLAHTVTGDKGALLCVAHTHTETAGV